MSGRCRTRAGVRLNPIKRCQASSRNFGQGIARACFISICTMFTDLYSQQSSLLLLSKSQTKHWSFWMKIENGAHHQISAYQQALFLRYLPSKTKSYTSWPNSPARVRNSPRPSSAPSTTGGSVGRATICSPSGRASEPQCGASLPPSRIQNHPR